MNFFSAAVSILLLVTLTACSDNSDKDQFMPKTHPLFSAIEAGDQKTVADILIREGKKRGLVDSRDECGWTPLMKAALNGHAAIAQQLINAGASVDLKDSGGYTALLLAASNNHDKLVRLLLNQGADINHQEQTKGWTALIWSAKRGHDEVVNLLLQRGADKAIRDFEGKSAADWSDQNQHNEITAMLGKHEKQLADVNTY